MVRIARRTLPTARGGRTILLALVASACTTPAPKPEPPRGHAHNDYLHARPLRDALQAGFTSVEVDVFLQGDLLLVQHERALLRPHRTLERLYLDPLHERARQNAAACIPVATRSCC